MKVMVIGCGGVATVTVHKCFQNSEVFSEIVLASRTKEKCDALAKKLEGGKTKITTERLDADNVSDIVALINKHKPKIVLNLALPYQNIPIMEACLQTKTHYLDTALSEHREFVKYDYGEQWGYHERFKEAGIMALLGCGFDPGVTSVFVTYAKKHYFDQIEEIDILDANGGDHGYPFATNFNPEINIREVSADGSYWENGKFMPVKCMSIKRTYDFDTIGRRDIYLMYHEEIDSIVKYVEGLKRVRFFMSFGQSYITHLKCLENVGMTSIKPIMFDGKEIVPLQFLRAVLPDPASLGPRTKGYTNIGCIFRGKKDGKDVKYYVYNICSHEESYKEVGSQAVSYTAGVPPMIGAMLMLKGVWSGKGVFNMEQFDPDPFMEELNKWGLPWKENFDPELVE